MEAEGLIVPIVGDVVGTAVGDAVGTVPMGCAVGGREAKVRKEARSRKEGSKVEETGQSSKIMGIWTQSQWRKEGWKGEVRQEEDGGMKEDYRQEGRKAATR